MTTHGRRSGRTAAVIGAGGATALVVALAIGAAVVMRSPAGPAITVGSAPTTLAATGPSPSVTPPVTSAKPSVVATTTRATTKPTPTRKPPPAQLPPAPTPRPDSASCTQHPGPDATMAQVRTALVGAGATQYWQGTQPPDDLTGELPAITVPAPLMKAVAWQESSWRSTVIACDGGIGTMQVMPGTAQFVNNRFGTSYDVHTLAGNTALGAAYLEWLTMYFGLYYFGSFDLAAVAPIGTGGVNLRLRDVVVAAYNVGPHALEDDHGTADGADDTLSIPNQWYVNGVTELITTCVCLSY